MPTRNNPTLSKLGERGFLKSLLPRLARFKSNRFLVAPGDDAAVLKNKSRAVLSIDALTEGTHFKLAWEKRVRKIGGFSLARGLGWKLMGRALSDLAAMGSTKNRWAMNYLGAPGSVRREFLDELYKGTQEAAQKFDCALAGGDTSRAKDLTLVGAVGGELQGRPLTRGDARPGDWICIAGTVGDALVGLKILEGKQKLPPKVAAYFVRRFFEHTPMFAEAEALAKIKSVTSMIDLSDSLAETMGLVCEASGVGMWVNATLVPVSGPYARLFRRTQDLFIGGEDYALFFTVRPGALAQVRRKIKCSIVGRVREKSFGVHYQLNGHRIARPRYFRHFS